MEFKKHLGQNFIKSMHLADQLLDYMHLDSQDQILEIGPGDGRFTTILLEKTKKVTSIEIDPDLIPILKQNFEKFTNFELINQDFLNFDLATLKRKTYKVFGALPYNVSKKIIARLLESDFKPTSMHFVLQHEVAQNYTANPPKATFLSNYTKVFGEPTYLQKIPREFFVPQPKVHSGLIQIIPHADLKVENPRKFIKFLKNGFRSPRKTLKNTLNSIYKEVDWQDVLQQNNLKENIRAAELTLEDWIALFKANPS